MGNVGGDIDERILQAQAGNRAAFQQLAELHVGPLCRCALALCHDRQTAEDIAQETLMEAYKSLPRFDGRCRFSTWLNGILRHRFLKHMSRSANRALLTPLDDQAQRAPDALGPERLLQQSEDAAKVRHAVAQLLEEHRQVIELRFFAGASLEEIAAALDVPLGTVKSRLHNGLEKLRKQNLSVNFFPSAGESLPRQI